MQQLTLDFNKIPDYSEHNFIVSQCNVSAMNALSESIIGHNPFANILLLYGQRLSGKTHLCNIWARKNHATFLNPKEHSLEGSSTATNKIIRTLTINQIRKILEQISHSNCVLENIEQFHSQDLMAILEKMISQGLNGQKPHQYLLTSSTWPLKLELPDLKSRINIIRKIDILPPDIEMLHTFVMRYFTNRSIYINPKVAQYLSMRVPFDFQAIIHILDQINQQSLINNEDITVPFLKKIGILDDDFLVD